MFILVRSGSSALTESCFLLLSGLVWSSALVCVANTLVFVYSILKNAFESELYSTLKILFFLLGICWEYNLYVIELNKSIFVASKACSCNLLLNGIYGLSPGY